MSLLLLFPSSGGSAPGTQTLSPGLFSNAATFYGPTVVRGTVTLAPSLFTNTQAFYSPTVSTTAPGQTLTASRFDSAQSFYAATLSRGVVTLTPARFDAAQTFYAATVVRGAVVLSATRFDSAQQFYSSTVLAGALALLPARLDNSQDFHAASVWVAGGAQTLEPALLVNENQFFGGEVGAGQTNRAGFEMGGRRVYIKRGRKIHIFDTVEDADAWEAAEAAAQEAIAKAKTRTAKRRIVRKVEAAIEHEVLRLDLIDALVARFNLKLDLPSIEARQDWAEYVRIAMLARELEDEEEIEALLLWV